LRRASIQVELTQVITTVGGWGLIVVLELALRFLLSEFGRGIDRNIEVVANHLLLAIFNQSAQK
jgi:hypothetical protein